VNRRDVLANPVVGGRVLKHGGGRVSRAGALAVAVIAAIGAACAPGADAPTASSTDVATFSVTLEPSVARVSPGGSTVSIATIRGVRGQATSTITGEPAGVSVRVASATIADAVQTTKYIIFVDAAAAPGTFALGVRVVAPDGATRDAQLTLVVTAAP
jgi:uncharacterized RDD family membrane protein YckC